MEKHDHVDTLQWQDLPSGAVKSSGYAVSGNGFGN